MNIEPIVFYLFSAILLVSALRVITARNPVHAALFLVLAFFTAAAIWMLLRAEFLAIVLTRIFDYHGEKRSDLYYTKQMLLAVGERNEAQIGRDRQQDAKYR